MLVVMPGSGDDWSSSTPWCAEATRFTDPDALVLHPKHTAGARPPRFHELTLGFIHLAGSLAQLDEREDDTPTFMNGQELSSPVIAYPMPEKPFKEQRKPPCMPGTEVEIRGGCWMPHRRDAPYPPGTTEYQGRKRRF